MFILLTSNEDQKILHTKANQFIYVNLLEEELEMQELRLQIDGTHKGDCKKPGETLTTD